MKKPSGQFFTKTNQSTRSDFSIWSKQTFDAMWSLGPVEGFRGFQSKEAAQRFLLRELSRRNQELQESLRYLEQQIARAV